MPRTIEFKGSQNVKHATLSDDGLTTVTFQTGQEVKYKGITPEMFAEWEAAESAGRWFHNRIRSKPSEYPVVSETRATAPPPIPEAAAAKPTNEAEHVKHLEGQLAAMRVEHTRVAKQRDDLSAELDRARTRISELEQHKPHEQHAQASSAPRPQGGSSSFRPWRNK